MLAAPQKGLFMFLRIYQYREHSNRRVLPILQSILSSACATLSVLNGGLLIQTFGPIYVIYIHQMSESPSQLYSEGSDLCLELRQTRVNISTFEQHSDSQSQSSHRQNQSHATNLPDNESDQSCPELTNNHGDDNLEEEIWLSLKEEYENTFEQLCFPVCDEGKSQSTFINLSKAPQIDLQILPSSKQMKELENQINQGDFSSFRKYWYLLGHNVQMKTALDFILDHWHQFRYQYESRLERIIHFFKARYEKLPSEITVFPEFGDFLGKIQRVLDRKAVSGLVNPRPQPLVNNLFNNYIKDLQKRIEKQENLYFIKPVGNDRIPLGIYVGGCNLFDKNRQEWKELWFEAQVQKMMHHQSANDGLGRKIKTQLTEDVMTEKRDDLITDSNLLCCARFFYIDSNLEPIINIGPVTVLTERKVSSLRPSTQRMRKNVSKQIKSMNFAESNKMLSKNALSEGKGEKYRPQILQILLDIVGLLNSGGGILLFDTYRSHFDIAPAGQVMTESDMFVYRCVLELETKSIQPRPKLGSQIRLSYVPIVKNPVSWNKVPSSPAQQRFEQGHYVFRAVVVPNSGQTLYTLKSDNEGWFCQTVTDGQRKKLNHARAVQLLKRKVKRHYVPAGEYSTPEQKQMLERMVYTHETWIPQDHQCVQPHLGEKAKIKDKNPLILDKRKLELQHKTATLIVVEPRYHEQVQSTLRSKGIECIIKECYSDKKYNLEVARHSAVAFHNVTFEKFLGTVSHNPSFTFKGRQMMCINITRSIKLQQPLKNENVQTLEKWLLSDFPNERMIYKGFADIGQFYIEAETRMSCLLMYFVLNSAKISGQLKHPSPQVSRQLRVMYQTSKQH